MTDKGQVLIVDDDLALSTVLRALLGQVGIEAVTAASGAEALSVLQRQMIDVVISDIRMPGMDGMQLLERIGREWPEVPVIMLTAFGTVPLAVEAMRLGAHDFMNKPFDREEIVFCTKKAIATARHREALAPPAARSAHLLGDSAQMNEALALIQRAAKSRATVLIRGESGTGKDVAARAIHRQSKRRDGPFIKVHCGALEDTLLASELFGHVKGAFTGATSNKPGRVELASGGTLFLDEIGDTSKVLQVKLLHLLQDRQFERVGEPIPREADVRFVAATHRNLEQMVENGTFREDLFYRLNVVPILMPPLRARPDEIADLARHFFAEHADLNGRPELSLADDAVDTLCALEWPGNVRQLQNFMERLVVLTDGPVIDAEDVRREHQRMSPRANEAPPSPSPSAAPSVVTTSAPTPPPTPPMATATPLPEPAASNATTAPAPADADQAPAPESDESAPLTLDESIRDTEQRVIVDAIARTGGNKTAAARILDISRRTLYNKLDEFGLS